MKAYCGLIFILLLAACKQHDVSKPGMDTYFLDTPKSPIIARSTPATTEPIYVQIEDSMYRTWKDTCVLSGKLIQKLFYGPPNFGWSEESKKTDAHYTFFILVLDKPVFRHPDYEEGKNEIDSIQIEDQRGNPDLLAKVGKHTSLKGILNEAIAPSQYTPVTMEYIAVVR